MHYKEQAARVDFDAADRIFVGHLAGIKDVIGFHTDPVDRLEAAFHETVDNYIATCAKLGEDPERAYSAR